MFVKKCYFQLRWQQAQQKGGGAKRTECEPLAATPTGSADSEQPWLCLHTLHKPESGPALRPPVDFPKPNYSPGTGTSLWGAQRPAHGPGDPAFHTGPETGDRCTTGKGCAAQTHQLTRSQPDVAGISDFTLTHPRGCTHSLPSLSPMKGDGCPAWCPGCPSVYSSLWRIFLGLFSLLAKCPGQSSPYRSRRNWGSCPRATFFPRINSVTLGFMNFFLILIYLRRPSSSLFF